MPSSWFLFPRRIISVVLVMTASLLGSSAAEVIVVINEFKADPPGSDTAEFIELYAYDSTTGLGMPSWPLDGYVVVLFNGGVATKPAYAVTPVGGTAGASIELAGRTTNGAGFFVIGSPAVAGVDLPVAPGGSGWLQNGPDAVGLYFEPDIQFTVGTRATAEGLVDAVVYGTDDPEDGELLAILTPGEPQINERPNSVESMARLPDGGDRFASSRFAPHPPTPGSINQPVESLGLEMVPPTLVEGETREVVVTRTGPTATAVTVTMTSSDVTAAVVPARVDIPAGAASVAIAITGVDDLWPDGAQSTTLAALAPGYVAAELTVTVDDDGDSPQPLVINEVYVTGFSDANQDGASSTNQDHFDDEFVEIVNRGAVAIDLSGHALFSAASDSARHTFPAGSVVDPGAALVVFGGGNPPLGRTQAFGTAWVQLANAAMHGLFLPDASGWVSLRTPDGREVAGFRYRDQAGAADSLTLNPDIVGHAVAHGSAGDGSIHFSPGTRMDGTPFRTVTASLGATIEPDRIRENAVHSAAWLTVERGAPFAEPLIVHLFSDDPSEAVPAVAHLTIPAGQATARVAIHAVDDPIIDGPQSVTFTLIAAGHLNGSAALTVDDDGLDRPPLGVFINEIDSDQPGADTGEFIELYVGEPVARPLDGFVVVLFNGAQASNGAYAVFDLSGRVSNAHGLFVIGNAAVPHVDLVIPNASMQNGADAVAVYQAPATAFRTGSNPSPPTPENLVDLLVYGNGSGEDADLLSAFFPFGESLPNSVIQYSEGPPNNAHALARVPDANGPFGVFVSQPPTPGRLNDPDAAPPPSIHLVIDGAEVVITFIGTLESSPTLQPGSFAVVPGATSPHRLPRPVDGTRFFRAVAR